MPHSVMGRVTVGEEGVIKMLVKGRVRGKGVVEKWYVDRLSAWWFGLHVNAWFVFC